MLHTAISSNNIHRIRSLLSLGADINQKDLFGNTPLHIAVHTNNKNILLELLSNPDILINVQNNDGKTPLHTAVENYCKISVIYLLACPEINTEIKDSLGNTPIYYCSEHLCVSILCILLYEGVNVNAINNNSQTPLHLGVCDRNFDFIKHLLEYNANPDLQDNFGNTPLNDAIWDKAGEDIINILLDYGADPTIPDDDGITCLHGAAWRGDYDIVVTLLNYIDPNTQCTDGMTPIYLAAMDGHSDIVQLLLNNDANPDICTNDGKTVIGVSEEITYIILLCHIGLNEIKVTDDVCPFCLENDRLLFKVNCCNTYVHRECAIEWGRKDCPVCRMKMF